MAARTIKELAEQIAGLNNRMCENDEAIQAFKDCPDLKTQLQNIFRLLGPMKDMGKDIAEIKVAIDFANKEIEELKLENRSALQDLKVCQK